MRYKAMKLVGNGKVCRALTLHSAGECFSDLSSVYAAVRSAVIGMIAE